LEDIKNLFEYVDIAFANGAVFLANLLKFNTEDVVEICIPLTKLTNKNRGKKRIVILTNRPNPAYVCQYNPELECYL
jgi:hypothetical protein